MISVLVGVFELQMWFLVGSTYTAQPIALETSQVSYLHLGWLHAEQLACQVRKSVGEL